jgi:pimeloyl-[acyl-carrier protein] methyl ester esterase
MITRLVLLPGMDGTGTLFADFVRALPNLFETEVVRYPFDKSLSYAELMNLVQAAAPASEPFVILAESFSTPLAVQYAATHPPNLKGLVLCAGFVSSPVRGWRRFACSLLAPIAFRFPPSRLLAELFLVGRDAPRSLVTAVRSAISSAHPKVLSDRLRGILACDVREAFDRITAPILYIQAQQDRLVHSPCLEEIRHIKPHVEVSTIAGPHLILQREPQKAAAVVARFVQTLA